jgi:uncharacterized protein YjbI with pentapeptide repeats
MLEELRSLGVLDAGYLPKLMDQVRAHVARKAPGTDLAEEGEPGFANLDAELAGLEQARDAVPPEPEELEPAEPQPESTPESNARPSGPTYDRIREALAPLFGRRAAGPDLRPVAVEAPTIPTSAWKPAPTPPRVEVVPPVTVRPPSGDSAAPASPAVPLPLLRQADVLGSGLSAAGRRYTDPTFVVAGLPRGILREADLSRSRFAGVRFLGRHRYLECRFADADLTGILMEAGEHPHQFVQCNFQNARFDASRIGFALFHECDLTGTRWSGARLERVRFTDCILDGAEWEGAELVETRILALEPAPTEVTPDVAEGEAGVAGEAALAEDLPTAESPLPTPGSQSPSGLASGAGIESPAPAAQPTAPPAAPSGSSAPEGTPENAVPPGVPR